MAKKARKTKRRNPGLNPFAPPKEEAPPETPLWRRGKTLADALDQFHGEALAKFDHLNRTVLPLVGHVRVINRLTKLVPGSRVHHQTGGSGRIQMISRGVAFVDWDNGRTFSIDLIELAAEDDL